MWFSPRSPLRALMPLLIALSCAAAQLPPTSSEVTTRQFPSESQSQQASTSVQKNQLGPDIRRRSERLKNADNLSVTEKKRQLVMALLEGVVNGIDDMSPVEWRILTEVETATVLWGINRQRAIAMLRKTIDQMSRLLEDAGKTTRVDSRAMTKEQMVWFLSVRRIAALDPKLVKDLLTKTSEGKENPSESLVRGIWTQEARAVLAAASSLIASDPALAALTAEQALDLGQANYLGFLRDLGKRDNAEAERLGMLILDRLNQLAASPLLLRNLFLFFGADERSPRVKNYYYQVLANRLRLEARSDASTEQLAEALGVSNTMARTSRTEFPYLSEQFDRISLAITASFKDRSLPFPTPPQRVSLDTGVSFAAASSGDTNEIGNRLLSVESIRDVTARDREYRRLAIEAASKADRSLAEDILSKIKDDSTRVETATLVYSPLVRSAISTFDWGRAQRLAALIPDPLARTLVLIRIAQDMAKAHENKLSVIDAYSFALHTLYRDDYSDRLAKAYLLIANPLLELDKDRGTDAIRSFAHVVSNMSADELMKQSAVGSAASAWIRYSDPSLSADDVLNIADLIGSTFFEIASRDSKTALEVASSISHRGLHSLAKLAIIKLLLKGLNDSRPKVPQDADKHKRAARKVNFGTSQHRLDLG